MCSYHKNFSNFIATLYLKKRNFLGMENTISIIITPTFKIVKIESNHNCNIPIKKGEYLNDDIFSKWVIKNNYTLNFSTKNSKFKRDLYFYFDGIILNNDIPKKNILNKIVLYLKSLYIFRIFIKK
jgi:hypothetical protein